MSETGYIGTSHVRALSRQLDMTANNIANAGTAGFKGERAVFESYLGPRTGLDTPTAYVLDRGSYIETTPGAVVQTGNPLDLALTGEGWFAYQTPDGQTAYGRDGGLSMDAEGRLVTSAGNAILDAGGGPVVLPPDAVDLTISEDGTVSAQGAVLARIGLHDLPDVQGFKRLGGGLLTPPDGAPANAQPAANARLMQGSLEMSNVDPVREMTRMIEIHRAYERTNALIGNADDLRRDTIRRIGQSG